MYRYKDVFERAEQSLLQYGSQSLPLAQLRQELDRFKTFADRELTDDEYYAVLVAVVFYAGFTAATVTAKMPVIRKHFPGFRTAARYTPATFHRFLQIQK